MKLERLGKSPSQSQSHSGKPKDEKSTSGPADTRRLFVVAQFTAASTCSQRYCDSVGSTDRQPNGIVTELHAERTCSLTAGGGRPLSRTPNPESSCAARWWRARNI